MTDGAGVMFGVRPTYVTQVPAAPPPEPTIPGAPRPPDLQALPSPAPAPPDAGDEWDAATLQAPPSATVLEALRARRATQAAENYATPSATTAPLPMPPVPTPPARTDVEHDIAGFMNPQTQPTAPRGQSARAARKAPAAPADPRRSPPPPPPTSSVARPAAFSTRPAGARPAGPPPRAVPSEKAADFLTGDSSSGVFASSKDEDSQDD
jgi:hypothetical protein